MTDADVDGAHIRTLLLTFFFRQMPQLFLESMIYIAQPPLYEIKVKGKKKSEYILSENQMRKGMIARGLEGTELVIRDGKKGKKSKKKQGGRAGPVKSKTATSNGVREVSHEKLAELVKTLAEAERIIAVLSRRGIDFDEFVTAYYDGNQLPCFRICVEGQEEIYYERDAYEKRLDKLKGRIKALAEGEEEESIVAEELHEVGRINQINEQLKKQFGLDLTDFILKPAESVSRTTGGDRGSPAGGQGSVTTPELSGEAAPTKFRLVNGEDKYEIASLGDICAGIRQIGGKGIEIKRFKGLGEMNADQLWDTTMNPETRTLLRVALDDAGETDRLFSILMGSDVEKRRNFIREHALEVQNLDV
jgi:DNA gyrase subunit B